MIPGIGLWTLAHAYLFWRVAWQPVVARRVPRWALALAFLFLWASLIVPRLLERTILGPLAPAVEFVDMTWMGVLLLLLTALLTAEVATGFGWLLRRHAARVRGWALVAGLGLSALAFVQGLRPPVVRELEIRLPGLPGSADGTVLVAVSDFHLGTLIGERWLSARIAQIEALKPDVVAALGDIVEGHGGGEDALVRRLADLRAPLGVWAVTGNHEFHGRGDGSRVLEAAGFRVLHDEWAEVRPGLILAGVDDLTSRRYSGQDSGAVRRAVEGRPAGATVLLSHTPWQAEDAARAGVGLMLCGHTHGGQIWPFTYLSATRYALQAGRYDVLGMPVLVSRGTGTWGPRMRLWKPGEIWRITLRSPERQPDRGS